MSLFDNAREIQSSKRAERLESQKSLPKSRSGTYLGKDLKDGTDIVQVDGQDQPVSGFKLISNKPISIGDRVTVRSTTSGLQRVDALNVKEVEVSTGIDLEITMSDFQTSVFDQLDTDLFVTVKSTGIVKKYIYNSDGNLARQTPFNASDFSLETGSQTGSSFVVNKDNIKIIHSITPFLDTVNNVRALNRFVSYELQFKGKSAKDFIGNTIGISTSLSSFTPLSVDFFDGDIRSVGQTLNNLGRIDPSLKINCSVGFTTVYSNTNAAESLAISNRESFGGAFVRKFDNTQTGQQVVNKFSRLFN